MVGSRAKVLRSATSTVLHRFCIVHPRFNSTLNLYGALDDLLPFLVVLVASRCILLLLHLHRDHLGR